MSRQLLLLLTSLLVVLSITITSAQRLYLGDDCELPDGGDGICKRAKNCPTAGQQGVDARVCLVERGLPIVCCAKTGVRPTPGASRPPAWQTTARPNPSPPTRPARKPTPVTRRPVPASYGTKSWEKCVEYANEVYTTVEVASFPFESATVRKADCAQASQRLIIGGVKTVPKEFPHMASLGFGEDPNIKWLCGGSLISERFVLTAAHCLFARGSGKVRWVQLGDLNIFSTTDESRPQRLAVATTERHPGYKYPSHYHDIALVRLATPARFDAYVRPACLHVNASTPAGNVATATGWGVVQWEDEELSKDLMKVDLRFYEAKRCNESFKSLVLAGTKLINGITEDTMICAGDPENKRDTCVGDSGGPLQVSLVEPYCMYSIVGLTSFGSRACGVSKSPAVYTRVSHYLPWIENIVWPDTD